MTERQKTIITRVRPYLSDVYRHADSQLRAQPVGSMSFVRVPRRFYSGSVGCDNVYVLKDFSGYLFHVHEPQRKGWNLPKFRKLLPDQP